MTSPASTLRILVYGVNYAPEPTGTGKYTGEMAEWLAARGHDVTAIVAPPHYPQWRVDDAYRGRWFVREQRAAVDVRRASLFVPTKDKLSGGRRILMETSFSASASRLWLPAVLRRRKFDVVIAVCPPMQVAVYPWLYRALRGTPWIFHVQDLQVDAAFRLGLLGGGLFERVLYRIENFFLRRATRVSTITEAMRRRIVEKGAHEDRTWLIPNWSNIDTIRPGERDNAFRRELEIPASDVLVLYAGNMGKKQGLDLIVEAADLMRGDARIHFVMVGSGADEPRIRALAADRKVENLRFLPIQPLERLPEMLNAADVHLVVQKREAADLVMPSKLTNILAVGRPAIATADPGTTLHQVLTEYEAGLVTPVEDVAAFVAAIRDLAAAPARRETMGRNARAYAEKYLDRDVILEDFEKKLSALVQEEKES